MNSDLLEEYKNRRIKINLINTFSYEGEIKEIRGDTVIFLDKFKNTILVNKKDIIVLIET